MIGSYWFRVCALAIGAILTSLTPAFAQCGTASWYHEGKQTANGERYRPDGITAAHRKLPFGTRVEVTHRRTGRSVVVRINDRGPFIRGRIIDLSRGAKRVIGMGGLAPVCIKVVGRGPRVVKEKSNQGNKKQSSNWSALFQEWPSGEGQHDQRKAKGSQTASTGFEAAGWPRAGDSSY